MTFVEVLVGIALALAVIAGALFFAFWTPNFKGPTQHDIRGNGDHAKDGYRTTFRSDTGGGDGGSD